MSAKSDRDFLIDRAVELVKRQYPQYDRYTGQWTADGPYVEVHSDKLGKTWTVFPDDRDLLA